MSDTLPGDASIDTAASPRRRRTMREAIKWYVSRFDEGEVMRWAFRGLLVGTIGALGLDFYEMNVRQADTNTTIALPSETPQPLLPPAFDPENPLPSDPRTFLTGDQSALRQPMSFSLGAEGVLKAEGAIDLTSAEGLAQELNARGEYVRTVLLNSPGGAVEAAMAMGKMLRERKLTTAVADGALCASSCPLMFAGGVKRLAGDEAAIGVHQFFVLAPKNGEQRLGPAQAMSDTQMTTARITRYLQDMGVDPALWLHAMDTPPQALYYFSPKELAQYRIATGRTQMQAQGQAGQDAQASTPTPAPTPAPRPAPKPRG